MTAGFDAAAAGLTWGMLDAIVRSAPNPIVGVGPDGRIRVWNSAATRLFGYSAEEAFGQPVPHFLAANGAERAAQFRRVLEGHTYEDIETQGRAKGGALIDVRLTLTPVHSRDGRICGIVAMGQDMSAQHRIEHELLHHLTHDALTGLFNRRRLTSELERRLSCNATIRVDGALLALDIDHFNMTNDSDGRAGGDRLLLFTADVLRSYAQTAEILARIGGDEFVLVLPGATPARALEVAREIRGRMRAYPEGPVHVSIGVAFFGNDAALTADDVLAAADAALQESETAGGDRATIFTTAAGAALARVEQVRSAIAEERLVLHGQPVFDLSTGEPAGHELLVRMLGRDGELVMPGEFIPVAERFGLIGEIDLWVAAAGIEMAAQGRHVAVNLSGLSIGNHELLELVAEAAAAGVDIANVTFEITETAATDRLPEAIDFSRALTRFGCGVALDDFGTGFGSFTYLKHLEARAVKIDVEFVRDLIDSETDREVVRSIVQVAHALGKHTIAEGIEDGATLAALKDLGADYAQGFFLGRPAPLAPLRAPEPARNAGRRRPPQTCSPKKASMRSQPSSAAASS